MTVIASYIQGGKVWIGSDSIGSNDSLSYNFGSKLIKVNSYIVGFAASYRVADLILECETFPDRIDSIKDARLFRDELKNLLIESGAQEKSSDEDMLNHPINIILATNSGIYVLEEDYQLHHFYKEFEYYSVGSGSVVATGSLFFASNSECDGENAVYLSVDSAIHHAPSCGGNIFIESISMQKLSPVPS